ncbi:histone-like nucleoid-structuring protein Lsr2 [Allokutzneria albata]|uniref:Lsr2 protein n=1 Tax=Allokutzneria albata TaxID=211114 RepID=A0A1G9Y8B0_ALLAB|nr:Lsr2 family protein [Allokutzneria albata]SDN05270.1 Lsr2 protein [Allokutzneria albata]
MAQRTIVQLIDDLDGTPSEDISRIEFALDGVTYEIDLSDKNSDTLRQALAPFVEAARRIGGRAMRGRSVRPASAGRSKEETKAIRDWAKANGHQVSDRGRIPSTVIEAFEAAHTV